MTQEDKELLLRDLSARLPYGVKVQAFRRYSEEDPSIISYPYTLDFIMMSIMFKDNIEEYKPYLFPLSNMTEKQKEEYCELQDKFLASSQFAVTDSHELFDWLDARHFDYRRLIEKGLALDATNKNIY